MPIEAKTKNKKKRKEKKFCATVRSRKYLAKVKQEGLPGASLFPFKIALCFYVRTNFPYLFLVQHIWLSPPPPSPPPSTFTCCLVPYYFVTFPNIFSFVPLFPQTPRSPSRLSFLKNQNTSFPISARPYLILLKTNSDISPIFIFCKK